jgi:hypothetical protein
MMKVWMVILAMVGIGSTSVPENHALNVENQFFIESNDVVLNLTGNLISGNTVKIGYKIPYPGYVEFFLFDKTGTRLWYNAYVKDKGDHFLAFKNEKLESGITYNFALRYKGKDYPGSFVNN